MNLCKIGELFDAVRAPGSPEVNKGDFILSKEISTVNCIAVEINGLECCRGSCLGSIRVNGLKEVGILNDIIHVLQKAFILLGIGRLNAGGQYVCADDCVESDISNRADIICLVKVNVDAGAGEGIAVIVFFQADNLEQGGKAVFLIISVVILIRSDADISEIGDIYTRFVTQLISGEYINGTLTVKQKRGGQHQCYSCGRTIYVNPFVFPILGKSAETERGQHQNGQNNTNKLFHFFSFQILLIKAF